MFNKVHRETIDREIVLRQSYLVKPMFQTMHDVLRPSFQQRKLISATFYRRSNVLVSLVREHFGLRSQMRHFVIYDKLFDSRPTHGRFIHVLKMTNIFHLNSHYLRTINKLQLQYFRSEKRRPWYIILRCFTMLAAL